MNGSPRRGGVAASKQTRLLRRRAKRVLVVDWLDTGRAETNTLRVQRATAARGTALDTNLVQVNWNPRASTNTRLD